MKLRHMNDCSQFTMCIRITIGMFLHNKRPVTLSTILLFHLTTKDLLKRIRTLERMNTCAQTIVRRLGLKANDSLKKLKDYSIKEGMPSL
jgi:hypothetical protein